MKRTVPTIAAVLALTAPIHLGETAATNDAAHRINPGTEYVSQDMDPRTWVKHRASRNGWRGMQWRCIDALVYRESRWHNSANATSSARGYFQLLKIPAATPLPKQYERFARYITNRYGTPCAALNHSTTNGWY